MELENKKDVNLRKIAYLAELSHVIDMLSDFRKSKKIIVDGTLLSVEIYDDFGSRYDLTVESLVDATYESFTRFSVNLWYNSTIRYSSTFTNLSFVKKIVAMLLEWYVEEDDAILYR